MDLHVHDMGSCCLSLSSPHSWSMKIFDLTSESSLGEEQKGRSASAIFLGENNIISRLHWPLLNDITCISTIFEPEWLWSIPCPRKAFSPPQVAPRTSLNFPDTLLRKSTIIQNTWPPQNKLKHPSHWPCLSFLTTLFLSTTIIPLQSHLCFPTNEVSCLTLHRIWNVFLFLPILCRKRKCTYMVGRLLSFTKQTLFSFLAFAVALFHCTFLGLDRKITNMLS